jgi:NAD(P)-dependent dehydrogenase (short-subunit alcohol dehydrogenase family)
MGSAAQFSFDAAEFSGKRVLVTGGTQGTGEAIARRFVASGARVATTAREYAIDGDTVAAV